LEDIFEEPGNYVNQRNRNATLWDILVPLLFFILVTIQHCNFA